MKKMMILAAASAVAATGALAYNTQVCAGCHGANFEKKAMNVSKIVKDMSKEEIIKALKGYKDGTYGGAMKGVMSGQVAKLSDEDIEAIATQIVGGGEEKKEEATQAAAPVAPAEAHPVKETAAAAMDMDKDQAKETAETLVDSAKEKATDTVKSMADKAVETAKEKAMDKAKDAAMDVAGKMLK